MSKFTDRLRVVNYFSDDVMAARMPSDDDLIISLRQDRKDAAAVVDEMETVLRDATNALSKLVDVNSVYRKDYEHPLSAYDRAEEFLKKFEAMT